MAENAEIASQTSSKTRLAENLSASKTWLRILKLVAMVMVVMMKQSKYPLFPKNQTSLQDILPFYTLEKDKFPLIVLAIVEALS